MRLIWFAIAGYPEIKRVLPGLMPDSRPGKFFSAVLCAELRIGEWHAIVSLSPGDVQADDFDAVIAKSKECIDWYRENKRV